MLLKLELLRSLNLPSLLIEVSASPGATVRDLAEKIALSPEAAFEPGSESISITEQNSKQVAKRTTVLTLFKHDLHSSQVKTLSPHSELSDSELYSGDRVSIAKIDTQLLSEIENRSRAEQKRSAELEVVKGPQIGKKFELSGDGFNLGRSSACELRLVDTMVSKVHARIEIGRASVSIIDLGSANGLVINGQVLSETTLKLGDQVMIGNTVLRLTRVTGEPSAESTPEHTLFTRSPQFLPRFEGKCFNAPKVPEQPEPSQVPWLMMMAPILMGMVIFAVTKSPLSIIFVALSPVLMFGNYLFRGQNDRLKRKRQLQSFNEKLKTLKLEVTTAQKQERAVRSLEAPSTIDLGRAAINKTGQLWSRDRGHWQFLVLNLGLGQNRSRVSVKKKDQGDRAVAESVERLNTFVTETEDINEVPVIESLQISRVLGVSGDSSLPLAVANALLTQLATAHSPKDLWLGAISGERLASEFNWMSWLPHVSAAVSGLGLPSMCSSPEDVRKLLLALNQVVKQRSAQGADHDGFEPWSISDKETINEIAKHHGNSGGQSRLGRASLPAIVILVLGVTSEVAGQISALLQRSKSSGIYVVWLARQIEELPAECATYLSQSELDKSSASKENISEFSPDETAQIVDAVTSVSVFYTRSASSVANVAPQLLSKSDAEYIARSISGLKDASDIDTETASIPDSVNFVNLLGEEIADDPQAIVNRWNQTQSISSRGDLPPLTRSHPASLRAIVGQSSQAKLVLDLKTQGPHALVGGTTGSGKSEFLQTWVLSLATTYSPDRVTFLFIDYKGGSAFAECTKLPHCVGLVTDLTPHLALRSLTSLGAEIRFREQLFNQKKFKDITQFEMSADPDCPPVLIIVIDEFATLATDMPQFVDGVVDIAQRGRSLGIHLIMATQRPAGVIKENLRANTNMRIALRMADKSDSKDVVGSDVAANFSSDLPGRAAVKIGSGSTEIFQSAYAGGFYEQKLKGAEIMIRNLGFDSRGLWADPKGSDSSPRQKSHCEERNNLAGEVRNDISRVVATCISASQQSSLKTPRKPWLDALESIYDLVNLQSRDCKNILPAVPSIKDDSAVEVLALGVTDDPHHQNQSLYSFNPDVAGNLLIFGTNLSGKSTLLRSLTASVALNAEASLKNKLEATQTKIFALDFATDGLKMLENLPLVGSVISGDDHERTARLIKHLQKEIDIRMDLFASVSAENLGQYRRISGNTNEARIYLLVDGLIAFRAEYENYISDNNFLKFQKVVADGRQLGVHVIATVERPSGLPGAALAGFNERIILRQTDSFDYSLLGVSQTIIETDAPSGRAIAGGLETQFAVFGGRADLLHQASAIQKLAESLKNLGYPKTEPVRKLPDLVLLDDLQDTAKQAATTKNGRSINTTSSGSIPKIAISISDDTLEQVNILTTGIFMISGPPSSGRSTALETICTSLKRNQPQSKFIYIGIKRSPLTDKKFWNFKLSTIEEILGTLPLLSDMANSQATHTFRIVLVIEAVSDLLETGTDREVLTLIKLLRRNGHFVVGESESSSWQQSWPILQEFKNARRGLALQPDPSEGELLYKTTFARRQRSSYAVGSALLVESGRAQKVQVAVT